jgi:putative glutamine amidotransferase
MDGKKPIIGITTSNGQYMGHPSIDLLQAYVDAILIADGIPVLIPSQTPESSWMQLLETLDGVLFTGGGDISPQIKQNVNPLEYIDVDRTRDKIELSMIKQAIQKNKPFFGICRGLQVLNVALGGTLYSDLSTKRQQSIKHDYYPDYPRNHLVHRVEVMPNSTIGRIIGDSGFEVNSLHHQGINTLADKLKPIGTAEDGLIEAVEVHGHVFGLAVQWHPEWLLNDEKMKALFLAFIRAAK